MVQEPKELPALTVPEPPQGKLPKPPEALLIKTEVPQSAPKLPVIRHQELPKPTEPDTSDFDKAISDISINMMSEPSEELYYPKGLAEGYFSEIEHYIKNKDINEIIDDILRKDMLISMKDYHENKAAGKAFVLHQEDLKRKLDQRMQRLRDLESEWHGLKHKQEETQIRKRELEKTIDSESADLKEIFKQVKTTKVLELECPKEQAFMLKNGQMLRTLNDLRKALSYMSDNEFKHHVREGQNDFAAWTEHVFGIAWLATKIRLAKSKDELIQTLNNPA